MIDALLYAVRDAVRARKYVRDYDHATCEIMDDGRPPPRCGNYFAAIHGGKVRNDSVRNLDKRYGFSVTYTMRVTVPLDRVGDQQIARNIALIPLALRQGFNARVEQLEAFLHENWSITVLTGQSPNSANDNLSAWATGTVYGFVEPAMSRGPEGPARLVGGEWFGADPEADEVGIVQELRFDGARRMQPQTASVGPFV